jgi:CRISPR-associated protein Cas2
LVRSYATGWQKSFFECFLSGSEEKIPMVEMAAVLNPRSDRFLLIRIDSRLTVVSLRKTTPPSPDHFFSEAADDALALHRPRKPVPGNPRENR